MVSKKKKAFITGITGQDGAWLAKLLVEKGYEVFGGARRTSTYNNWRLKFVGVEEKVKIVEFDLLDYSNIFQVIKEIQPDEFYNLAAQSFVGTSFKQPISTGMIDGMGVAYILDIIKTVSPHTKFYQASTSEMFGQVQQIPQTELTPFYPRSPYGCAKLYAHWMTVNYRESYGIFATSGILFNHESELRGPEFVTRKITLAVASRVHGKNSVLELGNLDARRDWGYAKEYVEGMYLMLQAEKPDNYVLATNETTTIRDFVTKAYEAGGIQLSWNGRGVEEYATESGKSEVLVKVNPEFFRPAEVELLIGSSEKALQDLHWSPTTKWGALAKIMVESDIQLQSL